MIESTGLTLATTNSLDELCHTLRQYQATLSKDLPHDEQDAWARFPFREVMNAFHAIGKHFVPTVLLDELEQVQQALRVASDGEQGPLGQRLDLFLSTLLDKHQDRYDYLSYTGIKLLIDSFPSKLSEYSSCRSIRVQHLLLLLADVALYECRTLLGQETRFPDQLTSLRNRKLRVFNSLKAIDTYRRFTEQPVWSSSLASITDEWAATVRLDQPFPNALGERTVTALESLLAQGDAEFRQLIDLTILPVWTIHDEYLFLRILQIFEMMFNVAIRGFEVGQQALLDRTPAVAVPVIDDLTDFFAASNAIFRVMTTITKENFSTFRVYTDGASAIQSEQYKQIEAMAAHPMRARLNSAAFTSTPAIKKAYETKAFAVFQDLIAAYEEPDEALSGLCASLGGFDRAFVSWKKMHYQIAVKMLGAQRGTGNTPGTPYLKQYMSAPLFPFLSPSNNS
ncbi:MAG TPA: hypothetical protein VFV52_06500 [Bacilli bacterium]|nr:hypothetical protein [Bacilli bacterium]